MNKTGKGGISYSKTFFQIKLHAIKHKWNRAFYLKWCSFHLSNCDFSRYRNTLQVLPWLYHLQSGLSFDIRNLQYFYHFLSSTPVEEDCRYLIYIRKRKPSAFWNTLIEQRVELKERQLANTIDFEGMSTENTQNKNVCSQAMNQDV